MNVLVAGGAGFIGSKLCRELVERGHEVTALSRTPDGGSLPEGVAQEMGDVSAYDSIEEAVVDRDAVVNLVSLSPLYQPPSSLSHDEVHRRGTENLVRACEDGSVDRFLQVSALDADPEGPTSFLRAKGRAEEIVAESGLDWTIVRPSVVFGDGAEFVDFTKTLTTPYVTGLPGGGSTRFQPIWVEDLVPMLADCLEDDDHVGERHQLGGPEVLTLAGVTELAYEAEGRPVSIVPVPTSLATLGLTVAGPVPFVPFGPDQARSLAIDNTVSDNGVNEFGVENAELRSLRSYLGIDDEAQ